MRIATSRLALQATPPDFDFVSGMSATSAIDHAVLKAIKTASKGKLSRIATLGWLWLRLRPYRLTDLVVTRLTRKFEQPGVQS